MKKISLVVIIAILTTPPAMWATACSAHDGHPAVTEKSKATANAAEAKYHCPMHKDVVSDKAGKCPKCNMNLEMIKEDKSDKK